MIGSTSAYDILTRDVVGVGVLGRITNANAKIMTLAIGKIHTLRCPFDFKLKW